MPAQHPRYIHFQSVPNFRDMGGYRTHDGRTVAWRRLFRSAALHKMNDLDVARLKQDLSPRAVIDLRRLRDPERNPEVGLLEAIGARYCSLPFRPDGLADFSEEVRAHPNATHLGAVYLYRIREQPYAKRLVDALEIIADTDNHPLVFHCTAGKDRTGVLAAMVLATMGVVDEDVVEDYVLSAPLMRLIRERMLSDPETAQAVKEQPEYHWEASAESMTIFLSLLRREYGSAEGYLRAHGASTSLADRLKRALLV